MSSLQAIPQLRYYQVTDNARIEEAWERSLRLIYQLPTGGGKSIVLSKIISDHKDENIIIFAHKKKLLTQLRQNLLRFGIKSGLLQGENEIDLDRNIIIVSIRTAVKDKRLQFLLERKWDRVIIDEGRHTRTPSYDKVLDTLREHNPQIKFLGVDATPWRTDGLRLDRHFQEMVVSSETVSSLIQKGFLPKYKIIRTPIGDIDKEVGRNSDDYQQVALSTYMRQQVYLDYVVDMYITHGQNKQAIVFAVDKSHAKALKSTFIKRGVTKVEQIDSDMSPEHIEKVFVSYENKETQVIINIEMVTEGVDLPETGVIVGARPTKSLSLYLQMVGRGTRVSEDSSDLIILDCCNWTEEHGTLSASRHWSLNPLIHPSNSSKKNKIVGKRENGTFVDLEEEEEFIGQVIEMTPEEYLQHLVGGMEKAEKVNLTIDEKISQLTNTIVELLLKKIRKNLLEEYSYGIKRDNYSGKEANFRLFFFLKSDEEKVREKRESREREEWDQLPSWTTYIDFNLIEERKIKETLVLYAKLENKGYSYRDDAISKMMKCSILLGELNNLLLDNEKFNIQVFEHLEQIQDLVETKINLVEFRETAKKFKKEQWEQKVLQNAIEGKPFILQKKVQMDSIYRSTDYWSELVYITAFQLKKPKYIKSDQEVVFTIETVDRHQSYSIKRGLEEVKGIVSTIEKLTYAEKLNKILEDGRWGVELEEK